ncbi:E1 ubiquitin-activating protein [Coemansia sp. RSA 1646]|nr:E1 ubiquitin-activating protein [Coemansia sp. RSA 1646]
MASTSNTTNAEIDESLYSRQLYVLGMEAMKKMSTSNVLVIGLKGLGCEIAKNVILAGVKSVTLYDSEKVQIADLSSQFYLNEDDIGKPRAEVSAPRLAELNQYVPVSVLDKELTAEAISGFKCIVATDISLEKKLELSEYAHKNGTCFISTEIRGLFGYVFNDFGEKFLVEDTNGEQPLSGMIANIEQSPEGVVTCLDETRHGLEDGQFVTFSEVKGMTELNGCEPRKITVLGPYTFSIGDTSSFGAYISSGLFQQVKVPAQVSFASFKDALENPEFLFSDFAKFDRPAQLHVGFQALHAFSKAHDGKLPRPGNDEDAAEFIRLTNEINDKWSQKTELSDELLKKLAYQATGDIPPMVAVFGGIAAQEVLKACTGKFSPINNFMYFDALECLPIGFKPTEADLAPSGSRYDGQIAVFGREFQEKISNYREFLVGSGAIGCEMLKNWAMMGLATGPKGAIHVTDMDTIEKSNLNRQFLFRPKDVGSLKSVAAAAAVSQMNPDVSGKIVTREDRVGTDTENIYNDAFFDNIDMVTNALDNVETRRYVDRRCVFYKKPLLESGTLGTKGNTQVVVPYLTESYSASSDPPEKTIPMCTLKNFPNAIEHTIQWARDLFAGMFVQPAENVNAYLTTPDYVETSLSQVGEFEKQQTLTSIRDYLSTDKPLTFDDCIVWARKRFEELYSNAIRQLLFNFPKDSLTNTGQPFWSPPKRSPDAVVFDASNSLHIDFIISAANLHAFNYGLKGSADREHAKEVAAAVKVPEFTPKSGVKIQANENDTDNATNDADVDIDSISAIISSLPDPASLAGVRLVPADFEKDDDTNFHIDFITAASNLRAVNYDIATADRFHTKQIAGKIIPAIATTTSLVAGLVCLELYKIIGSQCGDEKRSIENYKNGFVNLALPFFAFSEPIAPVKQEYCGVEFSDWDSFTFDHDITLQELIDHFKNKNKIEVEMVSANVSMLYSPMMDKKKAEMRKSMKVSEIIKSINNKDIPEHVKTVVLVLTCCDEDGEDVEVPDVHVRIRD